MSKKPTVLLLIPHLGGGGAEQVTARLACGLDPSRYDLHLATVRESGALHASLPPWVHVHALGATRVRFAAFRLLRLVRRIHPDLILSGMFHLNFLVLLLRPLFPRKTRVFVRQNGSLPGSRPSLATLTLYRLLYARADAVLCQTPAMAAELTALIGRTAHLQVLPNPIPVDHLRNFAQESPTPWARSGPRLLAVGRLSPEKGFDLLLHALVLLQNHFPAAHLTILGEGHDSSALRALALSLHLSESVHFAGHVPDPARWFPGATLFVLSSRHDALPNALLEAAAAGLPIVATPASAGIVHLLRNQPGSWLAPSASAEALADTLRTALDALPSNQRFPHPWIDVHRTERAIAACQLAIDQALAGGRP